MDKALQQDPQRTTQVALITFFNIMKAWHIEPYEQKAILGSQGNDIYEQWQEGSTGSFSEDVLIRISYVIGIYRELGSIFNDRSQADSWINKPNEHFNGFSALEYILDDCTTTDVDERLCNVRTLIVTINAT